MQTAKRIQLILVLMLLVILVIVLPVQNWLTALNLWSQEHPVLAVFAFSGFVVAGMVVMVPVSLQAMAAGFFFGLTKGFLVMWLAGLAGFAAAFLVGRKLARPWIEARASRRPEFRAIDKALGKKGLSVVLLARLSMVLPYILLNYSFGLTAVSLRDFLLGSFFGMVPGIFLFVFIGTTATDLAAILSGDVELGGYNLLITVTGVVLVAAAVVLITRVARRTFKEELMENE